MKLIMVAAISQDGFIASDTHPHPGSWTSNEDKEHLRTTVARHGLLVFGSGTYDVYGPTYTEGKLRVVLTRAPEHYQKDTKEGQLEFLTASPEEFVSRYEKSYESCLVLGGSFVYSSFLNAKLIDEIFLTVEPLEFGRGKALLADGKKLKETTDLPEPVVTKLNNKGTILKHYILNK